MTFFILISCFISIISGFLSYYVSGEIFIGIGVGIIFLGYLIFAYKFFIEKYKKDLSKMHECYLFINNFIISLSVQNSFKEAYEKATFNSTGYYKEILKNIEHLSIKERIEYLKEYFDFDLYFHFINILNLYEEQGGNILDLSKSLLEENMRSENALNESISIARNKLLEFSILWIITYTVLGLSRFALDNFFYLISSILVYKIMIVCFFVLVLVSIHFLIINYKTVVIKRGIKNA